MDARDVHTCRPWQSFVRISLASPMDPDTPSSRTRAQRGALSSAQQRLNASGYLEARARLGLPVCEPGSSSASHVFHGALAAASAATERGEVARQSKLRGADFLQMDAAERTLRVRAAAMPGAFPAPRRLFSEMSLNDPLESACAQTTNGGDPTPRVNVCLRVDDTDTRVVLDLRLMASSASAVEASAEEERRSRARLARARASPLSQQAQSLSYLGFNSELLQHLRDKGLRTITTAAVRRWLSADDALVESLLAAHGTSSFSELQIDHVVSQKWGGANHPFNYFVLPRSLNASFNSDITSEKVSVYMGKRVARCVAGFCAYTRDSVASGAPVDLNAFSVISFI